MKYQKLVVLTLCLSLITPSSMVFAAEEPVSAAEEDLSGSDENNEKLPSILETEEDSPGKLESMGTDMSSVFADLKEALDSGKEFQLSESLEDHSNMDISQEPLFDLSNMQFVTDTVLDMGTANLKYQMLSEQMKNEYTVLDVSGMSKNSIELFQNTYGDLANSLSLETPQLPDGFSVSEMLDKGSSTILSMYEDASHSGNFSSIKGSISIGNIFTLAKEGLSVPEMTSMDELSYQLESSSKNVTHQANQAYRNQMQNIREKMNGKSEGLKDSVNESYLNMGDLDNSILGMFSKSSSEEKKEKKKEKKKKSEKKTSNRDPKLDRLYQNKKKK